MNEFSYLRDHLPVAKIGYSIYVYDISLADANRMRQEMNLPLLGE